MIRYDLIGLDWIGLDRGGWYETATFTVTVTATVTATSEWILATVS